MSYNTIMVRGNGVREEATGDGAVTPGQLLERTSADAVKRHATAGGNAQKYFAIEDVLQGNPISTDYATTELVQFTIAQRGDLIYALLKNGEDVDKGDPLESASSGDMQAHAVDATGSAEATTIYSDQIVGWAREALDMSDSSDADPDSRRILIEVA